jgi:hypothetical protein
MIMNRYFKGCLMMVVLVSAICTPLLSTAGPGPSTYLQSKALFTDFDSVPFSADTFTMGKGSLLTRFSGGSLVMPSGNPPGDHAWSPGSSGVMDFKASVGIISLDFGQPDAAPPAYANVTYKDGTSDIIEMGSGVFTFYAPQGVVSITFTNVSWIDLLFLMAG